MNINRILIKNFKNYKGEHIFDLSKRITMIVGKNGYGKSSFFDAIEWCMTGRLNRFNKNEFNPKEVLNFNDYGKNLECKVELSFGGDYLERSFKYQNGKLGNMQIKLFKEDGEIIKGQKKVDDFFRNNYFRTKKEDSETFGDLIKQSHLLSQDQVTDFVVKDSPKDRFNSLAELVGLKNVLFTIENYIQIKKVIEKRIEAFRLEKININKQLTERRSDLEIINPLMINSYLRELKIKEKYRNSYDKLEDIKKNLEKLLFENNSYKQYYQDLIELGYSDINEIMDQINDINKNINLIESQISKRKNISQSIETLSGLIHQQKSKFAEYSNVKKQLKLINSNLSNNELSYLSIEEIKNLINKENKTLNKIEYVRSFQKSYLEINQFMSGYNLHKEKIKSRKQYFIKRNERINTVLAELEININKLDTGITTKLLDHLNGILNFVEENNRGECPVCSTKHGQDLPRKINNNININLEMLKKDTKYAQKYLSLKKRMIYKKNDTATKRVDFENKMTNLDSNRITYQEQLTKITQHDLFSHELFKISLEELDNLKKEKTSKISELSEVLTNKLEVETLNKKLELLMKIFGSDHSIINLEFRKNKLEQTKTRIQENIIIKRKKRNSLKIEYNRLYKEISKIEKKEKYGTLKDEIAILISEGSKIEDKIGKSKELLNLKQKTFLNKKIGIDIKRNYKNRNNLNIQILELQGIVNSINTFLQSLKSTIGSETTAFLNDQHSLIQKFYRYLNPMSNSKSVRFESEDGQLNIYIPILDNEKNNVLYNAKNTLSSGQLNVLAISIFLAVNQSQKVSKLDFIGIDDPIQNMDDVNRFSICDVISDLEKQVILSSHDMEFVKLFVKKNQHKSDQIQLYILESPILEPGKVKQVRF